MYFLSILCNGLAGFVLFAGSEDSKSEKSLQFSMSNPTFHLVLGILSAITGVLKLLSPMQSPGGSSIYILGDLIPAAAGITAGLVLIFGIYRQETSDSSNALGSLNKIGTHLLLFRRSLGFALMVVALLHFLFPQALFL